MLSGRDYTLVLDKSGSMARRDPPATRSRWTVARESALAFAARCEELDPDGITLYVFAGRFKRYERVTTERVAQVFEENEPCGGTDLAGVLKHALDAHFARKASGEGRPETLIVVTDGEPDDPRAVLRVIVEASRRVERDEELAISFIQVGNDAEATRFLKVLDDDLGRAGAKFDLCDTVLLEEVEAIGLTEVLLNAVRD